MEDEIPKWRKALLWTYHNLSQSERDRLRMLAPKHICHEIFAAAVVATCEEENEL